MIKTRTWILIILLTFILSTIAALWLFQKSEEENLTANIYVDDQCIQTIDLSAVQSPYSFSVNESYGTNVISVDKGKIRISEADCPDQICVHQGWQSTTAVPIVCLPHKLVIQLVSNQSDENLIDGVTQ